MSTRAEWGARIYCKESEIGGSFSVFVFLGDVPPNPSQWLNDPAFAGVFDVYTGGERDSVVHGLVRLNDVILERSRQSSLEEDVVVPFLKERLNWVVQRVLDGEVFHNVPSLEVTVLCTPLVGGKEGEPVHYHEITCGRPGGYRGIYDSSCNLRI